jgi:hypothetical protein
MIMDKIISASALPNIGAAFRASHPAARWQDSADGMILVEGTKIIARCLPTNGAFRVVAN